MSVNPAEVINIAQDVRLWAEKRAEKYGDTSPQCLTCYCAIASAKMSVMMQKAGIAHKLAMAESVIGSHVFVLVGNWIVDVTATQFGEEEKIFIKHSHAADLAWYHKVNHTFPSANHLIDMQRKTGWPREQIARAA
jgi:hypothetical protein